MKYTIRYIFSLCVALTVAACGGAGSENGVFPNGSNGKTEYLSFFDQQQLDAEALPSHDDVTLSIREVYTPSRVEPGSPELFANQSPLANTLVGSSGGGFGGFQSFSAKSGINYTHTVLVPNDDSEWVAVRVSDEAVVATATAQGHGVASIVLPVTSMDIRDRRNWIVLQKRAPQVVAGVTPELRGVMFHHAFGAVLNVAALAMLSRERRPRLSLEVEAVPSTPTVVSSNVTLHSAPHLYAIQDHNNELMQRLARYISLQSIGGLRKGILSFVRNRNIALPITSFVAVENISMIINNVGCLMRGAPADFYNLDVSSKDVLVGMAGENLTVFPQVVKLLMSFDGRVLGQYSQEAEGSAFSIDYQLWLNSNISTIGTFIFD